MVALAYFRQTANQWATFLPYIGHPGVLRNAQSGGGYRLYFENLMEGHFLSSMEKMIDFIQLPRLNHLLMC